MTSYEGVPASCLHMQVTELTELCSFNSQLEPIATGLTMLHYQKSEYLRLFICDNLGHITYIFQICLAARVVERSKNTRSSQTASVPDVPEDVSYRVRSL